MVLFLIVSGLVSPANELPSPSFIVDNALLEEPVVIEHDLPYHSLHWDTSFTHVEPGFWSSFFRAARDWSISGPAIEDPGFRFRIERSTDPEFADARVIYEGLDRSTVLSGMEEGNHYFRVQTFDPENGVTSAWSPVLTLSVTYASLGRALGIFTVGLLVSGLTIATILAGAVRTRHRGKEENA